MYVLLSVVAKELLQLRRDRKMLPMIFVAPALQLLALGYAANLDVTHIPCVLVDQDRSARSRALVDRFVASGYFDLVAVEDQVQAVEGWFEKGRAQVALVIGPGYGKAVASGRTPTVQFLADGSDSSAAGIGMGYAAALVSQVSGELVARRLAEVLRQRAALGPGTGEAGAPRSLGSGSGVGRGAGTGFSARIQGVPRVWYNPDLRSRWFYIPAVLALVLMVLTLVLASMGVVREKEIGTMEQLMVTPIRPWQLIVGKLFPFALIGFIDTFVVIGIAVGWFGVPLRGSLVLLVLLTLLLLLNTLGQGLLTSTLVRTQQQAMMTATFLLMLPQIYLSGLLFPIENMPRGFQLVTYAVPLRYYVQILRSIFLKGSGIDVLWPQAVVLAVFGVGFLGLASLRFRKRLD